MCCFLFLILQLCKIDVQIFSHSHFSQMNFPFNDTLESIPIDNSHKIFYRGLTSPSTTAAMAAMETSATAVAPGFIKTLWNSIPFCVCTIYQCLCVHHYIVCSGPIVFGIFFYLSLNARQIFNVKIIVFACYRSGYWFSYICFVYVFYIHIRIRCVFVSITKTKQQNAQTNDGTFWF